MSRDNAIVMRYDNPDIPSGRDIVYLHGRGSTEREAGFALPLFGRANVRSYRGPLPQGPGFAWFENAGIGVALPSSLSGEKSKVGDWIAADTGRQRPWLCGFSNGAAKIGRASCRSRVCQYVVIAGCAGTYKTNN